MLKANYEAITQYAADVAGDKIEPRRPVTFYAPPGRVLLDGNGSEIVRARAPLGERIYVPTGEVLQSHGAAAVYREGACVVIEFVSGRAGYDGAIARETIGTCTDRWFTLPPASTTIGEPVQGQLFGCK